MNLPLQVLRRVAAQVLAGAVLDLFPGVLLVKGEVTQVGFYYDFDFGRALGHEMLDVIEERMRGLAKEGVPIDMMEMMRQNAMEMFRHFGQPMKVAELESRKDNVVQVWRMGKFHDVVAPPYGANTTEAGAFKLLEMIQIGEHLRIIGTAFPSKSELKIFLKKQEAAKKVNHKLIGKEMHLLFEDQGNWFLTDKGSIIKETLLDLWRLTHSKFAKVTGNVSLIYKSIPRHFKDFPIRFANVEPGEDTGLDGLFDARSFTMDRAQIFCLHDQIEVEMISYLHFIDKMVNIFGFEYQWILHTKSDKTKGAVENWDRAIDWLTKALKTTGLKYTIDTEEKVENGPLLEVHLQDALGRSWKGPFIGVDLRSPMKYGLEYIGADGKRHKPIVIESSIFGSLERFIALMIEKFGGMFPLWLAPEQVRVIPIAERNAEYAQSVKDRLDKSGLRAGIDYRNENLGMKVHAAEVEKAPYMLIVGDKEEKCGTVTVRKCLQETNGTGLKIETFLEQLQKENDWKCPAQLRSK